MADADGDNDGIMDCADNCPTVPNGPQLGTCTDCEHKLKACHSNAECGVDGFCSMNQENTNGGDYGDVCLAGRKKWEFATGGNIVSSPAVGTDGTVYVGSSDKKLYAINPDGTEKWAFPTGGEIYSSPAIDADGVIYVSCTGSYEQSYVGRLYAINPDGSQKWEFTRSGRGKYSTAAIGADGTVYAGSEHVGSDGNTNGNLYAINPDGTEKWVFWVSDLLGGMSFSSPTIGTDGAIYISYVGIVGIGNYAGGLYAINQDGTRKWYFHEYQYSQGYFSAAIGADGTVFASRDGGSMLAIDPDGLLKW